MLKLTGAHAQIAKSRCFKNVTQEVIVFFMMPAHGVDLHMGMALKVSTQQKKSGKRYWDIIQLKALEH